MRSGSSSMGAVANYFSASEESTKEIKIYDNVNDSVRVSPAAKLNNANTIYNSQSITTFDKATMDLFNGASSDNSQSPSLQDHCPEPLDTRKSQQNRVASSRQISPERIEHPQRISSILNSGMFNNPEAPKFHDWKAAAAPTLVADDTSSTVSSLKALYFSDDSSSIMGDFMPVNDRSSKGPISMSSLSRRHGEG